VVWRGRRPAEAVRCQLPTSLSQRTAALLFGCCPEAASVSACAYPLTRHPEGCLVRGAPATPRQPLVGGGVGVASSSSKVAFAEPCPVLPPLSACLGSLLRPLPTEVVIVRCHTVRTSPKLDASVPAATPPRCGRARRLRHGAEAPWQVELGGGPLCAVRSTRRWCSPRGACTACPPSHRGVSEDGAPSSRRRGSSASFDSRASPATTGWSALSCCSCELSLGITLSNLE